MASAEATEQSTGNCDVGLYGLAVMGQNFALNMASKGFRVSVCNRSPERIDVTVKRAKDEGDLPLEGHAEVAAFVNSIKKPRRIIMLVMAGKPVDDTIALLAQHMESVRDTCGLLFFQFSSLFFFPSPF
jgi:6-phosphogluconate dehydrogenase